MRCKIVTYNKYIVYIAWNTMGNVCTAFADLSLFSIDLSWLSMDVRSWFISLRNNRHLPCIVWDKCSRFDYPSLISIHKVLKDEQTTNCTIPRHYEVFKRNNFMYVVGGGVGCRNWLSCVYTDPQPVDNFKKGEGMWKVTGNKLPVGVVDQIFPHLFILGIWV